MPKICFKNTPNAHNNANNSFKIKNTYEVRKRESDRMLLKYKDRVPVIIELDKELFLAKTNFLVPFDLSISQFLFVIRDRIKISSEKAIFLFFNNTIPASSETVGSVYKKNKDIDGFLYGIIMLENTFG